MKDIWYRRLAWGTAILELIILVTAAVMLWSAPDHSSSDWLYAQVAVLVAMGAPILGLIIVARQPRQRIGWLWILYGLLVGLGALGRAVYYYGGAQPAGYSALEYFLLWSTELTNVAGLIAVDLLLLWFPDGQLASRRWRFIYIWLFLAATLLVLAMFVAGPNWNGGADSGGIVFDNPYGWLPEGLTLYLGFPGYISLILIGILAAVSLIFRYRAAGQLIRLQLRWFVLGGFLYLCLSFFLPTADANRLLLVISFSSIVPLYVAVGVAILRYRLYGIDIIIRKTLVYALITGLLALVYFGIVVLLQAVFESASGEQSPIAIVISTLVIAALFAPLRRQVQEVIDRRFYRKKYDAQQVLAQFAQTARDETDMDVLTAELVQVVQETMQPATVGLWLQKSSSSGH